MQRFEGIYVEHAEAVRLYVRRRAPEAIVEDVVSDIFLVCLRRIDGFRPIPCRGFTPSRGRRSRMSDASAGESRTGMRR